MVKPVLHHYRMYGLRLASEIPFRSLRKTPPGASDLVVRGRSDGELPDWRAAGRSVHESTGTTSAGTPYLRVVLPDAPTEGSWRVRHTSETGAVDFELRRDPLAIHVTASGDVEPGDLEAYFTGPVMGHFLRMVGRTCLHGGFLAVQGEAVGIIGAKGAGKSSLTAAAALAGLPVLADDVGVLDAVDDGRWRVLPGYPRLRLWPATLRALGLDPAVTGSALLSFAEKLAIDLDRSPWRHASRARPLRCILVLEPRRGRTPEVVPTRPGQALTALMAHVYAPWAGGMEARRRDLSRLSALCRHVPVYRVALPEDITWLRTGASGWLQRLAGGVGSPDL